MLMTTAPVTVVVIHARLSGKKDTIFTLRIEINGRNTQVNKMKKG